MIVHQVHVTISRGEWLDLIRLAISADADKAARQYYTGSGRPLAQHIREMTEVQTQLRNKITVCAATDIHIAAGDDTPAPRKGKSK